jgi:acyl transferase domain-containing protein
MSLTSRGECQLALVGGASLEFPQQHGYHYQAGMIYAPDGKIHSLDHKAHGTVPGEGVGVVVLADEKYAIKYVLIILIFY